MFEEEAEEYENAQDYCNLLDVLSEEQWNQDYGGLSGYISPYIKEAYLAGLKAGIVKLRYCCTCKKWKECVVVSMYGICDKWEIKE